MLYVSDGYPVEPLDAPIARVAEAALRANVTVFAMNARAVPGARAAPAAGDAALSTRYRTAMLDSLRSISELTCGFAVLNEADFSGALERISDWIR